MEKKQGRPEKRRLSQAPDGCLQSATGDDGETNLCAHIQSQIMMRKANSLYGGTASLISVAPWHNLEGLTDLAIKFGCDYDNAFNLYYCNAKGFPNITYGYLGPNGTHLSGWTEESLENYRNMVSSMSSKAIAAFILRLKKFMIRGTSDVMRSVIARLTPSIHKHKKKS